MCAEGAMEGVDAIIALHGWPGVAVGKIALRAGAVMASADMFRITVHGSSGHAAYPHRTVDPIAIGAQIVTNLQQISSREADPVDPVVVTVGRFSAGTAHNIIPDTAELLGTYRSLQVSTRNMLAERIRRTAEGICAAHRASCTVEIVPGTPPVVNDPAVVKLLAETASDTFGSESVVWLENSSMGAEDFAEYLAYAPGAMFRLGLGDVSPLHTPTYNWEDRALPVGVELFTRTALRYLCTQQEQPCHAPS
jgi:amidohydrolase